MCSLAEVCGYVGRAYWQRPLADCRAQRALGFGSNRRILGESAFGTSFAPAGRFDGPTRTLPLKPELQNRCKKSGAQRAVNYTACDLWTRSCREEIAPSSLPRFARKARCQTPPSGIGRPERQKAKSACHSDVELRRVRSDYKRTAGTQPWPASARRAPTPGRRSRASRI